MNGSLTFTCVGNDAKMVMDFSSASTTAAYSPSTSWSSRRERNEDQPIDASTVDKKDNISACVLHPEIHACRHALVVIRHESCMHTLMPKRADQQTPKPAIRRRQQSKEAKRQRQRKQWWNETMGYSSVEAMITASLSHTLRLHRSVSHSPPPFTVIFIGTHLLSLSKGSPVRDNDCIKPLN
eukprot:m.20655 g.20655  ORF g.20655 m.20655 type:complete len:182 (+) comp8937_c0_seq1:180-725(+)